MFLFSPCSSVRRGPPLLPWRTSSATQFVSTSFAHHSCLSPSTHSGLCVSCRRVALFSHHFPHRGARGRQRRPWVMWQCCILFALVHHIGPPGDLLGCQSNSPTTNLSSDVTGDRQKRWRHLSQTASVTICLPAAWHTQRWTAATHRFLFAFSRYFSCCAVSVRSLQLR